MKLNQAKRADQDDGPWLGKRPAGLYCQRVNGLQGQPRTRARDGVNGQPLGWSPTRNRSCYHHATQRLYTVHAGHADTCVTGATSNERQLLPALIAISYMGVEELGFLVGHVVL